MKEDRFIYFCDQYKKRINLPFFIQTRCEEIKEDRIKMLKEINISSIGIGIEHGNEEFRKKYLNRGMSNEDLKNAFAIVHKYNIRSTANLIIGMPYEKESMLQDTINLLKEIKPKSYGLSYYMPFRGTKMFDLSVEIGAITKDHIISNSNDPLNLPDFPKEKIKYYFENLKYLINKE
jgi:radical SAM superfamily enzyme YgiQ (UPF0313 family)